MAATKKQVPTWLAFLDIYGFAAEVGDGDAARMATRLTAIHAVLNKAQYKSIARYIFSDTIVAISPHRTQDTAGYDLLVNLVKDLQNTALRSQMILRGALAHGEMMLGANVCFGPPLLRAYACEQKLAIPIVVVPKDEFDRAKQSLLGRWHDVPTKTGLFRAQVLLPEAFLLQKLITNRMNKTMVKGPDHVARVWREMADFVKRAEVI